MLQIEWPMDIFRRTTKRNYRGLTLSVSLQEVDRKSIGISKEIPVDFLLTSCMCSRKIIY